MFERAVLFSTAFTFTGFCLTTTTLWHLIDLKAESPITIIQELLPSTNQNTTAKTANLKYQSQKK